MISIFIIKVIRRPRQRTAKIARALSCCRSCPPEKLGIDNPPLPAFGFAADPFALIVACFQTARHEYLVVGSEVGAPIDIDPSIVDLVEGTFSVEHDDDVVDIVTYPLGYLAPGRDVNRLADPIQRDP